MKVKVNRLSDDKYNDKCLISRDIFDKLNLSDKAEYNIHVGQLNYYSFIKVLENEVNTIMIPDNIFDKLYLVDELDLNIKKENQDIYLGPIVGIFINHYNFPLYEDGSAPKHHARGAISQNCLCYYFSTESIDWNEKRIKGYTLLPSSEEWANGWFPMPDVIYDRGVGFEQEEKQLVKEIRKRLKNYPNMKIINRRNYLSKKETYEKLFKYPEINKFFPKTINYTSFNDVIIMLKQYDFVFIKASLGSGGKQVLSIEKENEEYKLIFYSGGLKELDLKEINEVRDYVENFTEGRQFIIQEGIRLLKYKGQVFDMRLLTIKNNQGKWRVISNWSRIAKANYTITNYCAGGGLELYENMYNDLIDFYGEDKIPSEKQIEESTIMIAEYIEKAFGSFGEIGMDMAIDIDGKLWFIEANTKPDKDLVEGYDDFDGIPPQNLAIFEYARYLVGFND